MPTSRQYGSSSPSAITQLAENGCAQATPLRTAAGITSLPKSWLEFGSAMSRRSSSYRYWALKTYSPMLASAMSVRPGMGGGLAGFSTKSVIWPALSTAITPNALASEIGTSMQPTVTSAPLATWYDSSLP